MFLIFKLFVSVTNSLTDLSDFIHKADQGLLQIVEDYETLVSIMAFLLQVKERAVTTDTMFEPMRGTIDLLKYYDMDIPEEVNVLLQELPEQWNNTKKLAVTVKQQVAPLQATEVVSIRNRISNFDCHINVFREIFKTYEFFKYNCDDPYILLDRISDDIYRLESEMAAINESGSLFEVNVPEFKLLKQCRRELKMLKV
jgi:dynein heavy chain, axonemal